MFTIQDYTIYNIATKIWSIYNIQSNLQSPATANDRTSSADIVKVKVSTVHGRTPGFSRQVYMDYRIALTSQVLKCYKQFVSLVPKYFPYNFLSLYNYYTRFHYLCWAEHSTGCSRNTQWQLAYTKWITTNIFQKQI